MPRTPLTTADQLRAEIRDEAAPGLDLLNLDDLDYLHLLLRDLLAGPQVYSDDAPLYVDEDGEPYEGRDLLTAVEMRIDSRINDLQLDHERGGR